jgi:iron uptake system component EfeO
MRSLASWGAIVIAGLCAAGCKNEAPLGTGQPAPTPTKSAPQNADDAYRDMVVSGMHDALLADLNNLHGALMDLQNAAPTPSGRGWDATMDKDAIASMKAAWVRARTAYEHIEGALAPIFPDIDASIDARYDDFLTMIGPQGDTYLFDDKGVTGLHGIERILYSDVTPQRIIDFEKVLPGYKASAFPGTAEEATDFKGKLVAKAIADSQELLDQWTPAHIDIAVAFQGLVSLMNEQREKVNKASSNEEESRYSQRTMADIRDNLAGTTNVYKLFETWLMTKKDMANPTMDGPTVDGKILGGFQGLSGVYGQYTGDSIPAPPASWSSEAPSSSDLMTPFGQLYSQVRSAVDPNQSGTIVAEMNSAATILGFPLFKEM